MSPQHRLALEMLADAPGGCAKDELSAYHGFETLAGLVREGLARAQLETTRKSGRTIEVAKITNEGWRRLISLIKSE